MEGEVVKYYAEVGLNLQMVDEADVGCPEGWIEMLYARPEGELTSDYTAQADGSWSITQETLNTKQAPIEMAWRDSEMLTAQQNVTAIDYGDEDIPGTAQQWQKYWLALRKWTETNPDFPDSSKRPVAPT